MAPIELCGMPNYNRQCDFYSLNMLELPCSKYDLRLEGVVLVGVGVGVGVGVQCQNSNTLGVPILHCKIQRVIPTIIKSQHTFPK